MILMHSIADIAGVNTLTRQIFTNAAAAITGMIETSAQVLPDRRPIIGTTMLGLTTPCVLAARARLEAWSYEVVTFHPNGTGGRCLERLVAEGLVKGVLDLSLQEITGHICHAGADRLKAAGRLGMPQVVAPGGTDYIVLGPLSALSDEQRRRPRIIHNPNITLVRTTKEEMKLVGETMASRLNAAEGRVAVLIPTGGFSYSDRPGHALYDPVADEALIQALEHGLESRVDLLKIDAHINDPAFAEAAASKMHALMSAWHPQPE
jgi:uncharacterized protein (UPF0261 family)